MKKLIAWVEIPAKDMKRAVTFYNQVLDLELEALDFGHEQMALLPDDAGAISLAPGFEPSADGVLVSFNPGRDLDAVLALVEVEGGKVLKAKTKIEAEGRGWFALFLDPEGNRVGLYQDL